MNYLNMMELLKDQINYETFYRIKEDFIDAWREEYRKIRPCTSAAEKAQKRYMTDARKDEHESGLYTTGTTVLYSSLGIDIDRPNINKCDIREAFLGFFKDKKPVDARIEESIALYKILKKQEKQDYRFIIDGNSYNMQYIAELYDCIALKKDEYIYTYYVTTDGKHPALLMQGKAGIAVILPIIYSGHFSQNCNFTDFCKYNDEIDRAKIDEIRKSA